MHTPHRRELIDVQAQGDDRGIPLDEVGVAGLRLPIAVGDGVGGVQRTVAEASLSVALASQAKGTHMSRFLEVMGAQAGPIGPETMPELLRGLAARLGATRARAELRFPVFRERRAPVSGVAGLVDYDAWLRGTLAEGGCEVVVGVRVPVTSLCPCSKAISDYGAHNQRGYITIEAVATPDLGHDALIEVAEQAASAPIYAVLKREDERHVTMQAYDNPALVEDMARAVATALIGDPRIAWFEATVTNQESIHNHDAYARVAWRRHREGDAIR